MTDELLEEMRKRYIGHTFDMLTVTDVYRISGGKTVRSFRAVCKCACGNTCTRGLQIFSNDVKHNCGCISRFSPQRLGKRPWSEQPCWHCKWATGLDAHCPWARELKPVKGWDADLVRYKDANDVLQTYRIYFCPMFERGNDGRDVKGKKRKIRRDGL